MFSEGRGAKLELFYPSVSLRRVMECYAGIEYTSTNQIEKKRVVGARMLD